MIKSISTRSENQIRRNFLRKEKTEVNTLGREATILCSKVTAKGYFFYRSLINPGQSKKEKTATKKPVKRKSQKQIKKERKYA